MHRIDEAFCTAFPSLARKFSLTDIQRISIEHVLDIDNTLCIIPTGGGKSLVYWLSGIMLGGITLVISPLIALIDEQCDKLREQGYEVMAMHGGNSSKEQAELLVRFANGEYSPNFIFTGPERIAVDGFFEYCLKKRSTDFSLIAIDEVHCVSQWGLNFRPFYRRIPEFIESVFTRSKPHVLALTATLNPKEVEDICSSFMINKNSIIKDSNLMRAEINLHILDFVNEDSKEEKLWDLLSIHSGEKTLVYVYRKSSERGDARFSEKAIARGFKATYFDGDMTGAKRRDIIAKYKAGEYDVIFATNAFGMGIDISDIRVIIHFMIPESVEQYYQEIGRAARDGKSANAYLLFSVKNIDVKRRYFIDASLPSENQLNSEFKKLGSPGYHTFPYFDDENLQRCFVDYLDQGLIAIRAKGFATLKNIKTSRKDIHDLCEATKTQNIIETMKKTGKSVDEIVNLVYGGLVNGSITLAKVLDKRFIIEVMASEISDNNMNAMLENVRQKRKYKHELLDYLVFLIDSHPSSIELHQNICLYLGMDKHRLNCIYSTSKGDKVRSKSEVIIANLLYQHSVNYDYEQKLFYEAGKWIEPDFTIHLPSGENLYWEHLGMLGSDSYDRRWLEKLEIYNNHFPNKLLRTYEGATITDAALELIEDIR